MMLYESIVFPSISSFKAPSILPSPAVSGIKNMAAPFMGNERNPIAKDLINASDKKDKNDP